MHNMHDMYEKSSVSMEEQEESIRRLLFAMRRSAGASEEQAQADVDDYIDQAMIKFTVEFSKNLEPDMLLRWGQTQNILKQWWHSIFPMPSNLGY